VVTVIPPKKEEKKAEDAPDNDSMETDKSLPDIPDQYKGKVLAENMTGKGLLGIPEEMIPCLKELPNLKMCFDTNSCSADSILSRL